MPFITRKSLLTLTVLSGVAVAIGAVFIWSGIYNIGADDTHTRPVHALLQAMRERSIDTRAHKLPLPADLTSPARITQGAGNYAAMCTGCHLAPGMEETELSKGLYPAPPNLAKEAVDAAEAFWVIKHGIKASGMPAWGKSMDDEYIWNMAAFLQQLPKLSEADYKALVASSGGHSHGGGETKPHGHAEGTPTDESKPHAHPSGTPAHEDKPADPHAGMDMGGKKPADESKPHSHAPGTPPHDDAPAKAAKPHSHAPGTPPHDDAPAKAAKPASDSPGEPATSDPATDERAGSEHQH